MREPGSQSCYEFDGYHLDTRRRRLVSLAARQPVSLPPRVFDTLVYFVEHPDRLIDKSTLLDAIWPDKAAEENSLTQNISVLRRALGETASLHRFIVTVPGRGYRFVANVVKVERFLDDVATPASAAALTKTSETEGADADYLYGQAQGLSILPSEDNLRGALRLLTQATTLDPGAARVWSLMSEVYSTCAMYEYPIDDALTQAERAAQRAIALDSGAQSSYAALGVVQALRGRWVDAEMQFRLVRAITADPFVTTLHCLHISQAAGHLERALEEALEAHRSTSVRQFAATMVATTQLLRGEDAEALRWADEGVALGHSVTMAPQADVRVQLALRAGRHTDAANLLTSICSAAMRAAGAAEAISLTCAALRNASLRSRAVAALRALEERLAPGEMDQSFRKRLVIWYTMLGNLEAAYDLMDRSLIHWAQRGFVGSAWGVLWLPEMRLFRADPRFQTFAERLGLIPYWEHYGPPDGHVLRAGQLLPR